MRPLLTALALALAAPALVAPALAQSPGDAEAGADAYAVFCATCHGAEGEGDGPTAEILTVAPPDLTRLAARNDGAFPVARVVSRIDGRDPLLAHGAPMPLFGPYFEGEGAALRTPAGQPILTSRPIADLVAWLRSIQVSE
jgi:mono/diheme cytochrome c family protein